MESSTVSSVELYALEKKSFLAKVLWGAILGEEIGKVSSNFELHPLIFMCDVLSQVGGFGSSLAPFSS